MVGEARRGAADAQIGCAVKFYRGGCGGGDGQQDQAPPIVIDFFETKLDAWRQVVRNPQFERLPLLLLHCRLKNRADSRMITVSHPPNHIGKVLIGQTCGIGQGRDQLADQRSVSIVFLELDPCGFRWFGAQIVHQPAGAFRAHDRVKGHRVSTF